MRSRDLHIGHDYAWARHGAKDARAGHTSAGRIRVLDKRVPFGRWDGYRGEGISIAPVDRDGVAIEARKRVVPSIQLIKPWAAWDTELRIYEARRRAEQDAYEEQQRQRALIRDKVRSRLSDLVGEDKARNMITTYNHSVRMDVGDLENILEMAEAQARADERAKIA